MQIDEKSVEKYLQLCRLYLIQHKKYVALAESCTGGWISKYVTDQPGSSSYYWGGVCSYADEAKIRLLDVPAEHLEAWGAVSEVAARDMVQGILKISGSDFGVSVTGIAGPGGGSDEKPVGLVYIAAAGKKETLVQEYHFQGSRDEIRLQTVEAAFQLLWKLLNKI